MASRGLQTISEDTVEYFSHTGANRSLPVDLHRDEILSHIDKYRVTFIEGDTGSGKSTRVPQYIVQQYEDKKAIGEWGIDEPRIVVTQPRRIAAKSLAKRVAMEMQERVVGDKVGYKIGQEQCATPKTQICYVTSGYLIELLVHNPSSFDKYSHVILDEIHERDLDADLLTLMVKLLMEKYEKPRVIIMSATLQVELFLDYFSEGGRQVLQNPGEPVKKDQLLSVGLKSEYITQTYYVEDLINYCEEEDVEISSDMLKAIEWTFKQFCGVPDEEDETAVSRKKIQVPIIDKYIKLAVLIIQASALPSSSILVFLPGVREIEVLYDLLMPYEDVLKDGWKSKLSVFTLHSRMPFEDQQKCFDPPDDLCHVILATNMAESSVTLPNVNVVIDFGQRRHLVYDHRKRISVLKLSWCSQASLNQRKGRTGRTCNGLCFRLMTEDHFNHQDSFDPAQMKLAPLEKLVLQVKYVGDHICPDESPSDLLAQAIEPPPINSVDMAVKNLADMGALCGNNEDSEVTLLGKFCMSVPLDLYLCRLVFFGMLFNCPCDAIVMAATLQSQQDPFKQPSKKVLKNMERFVNSQRRSFDSRKKFDDHTYSEPLMYRNLIRNWCEEVIEEERKRQDGHGQSKGKKDMKTFRAQFGRHNAVDAKRLLLVEGVISDVCEATAKWYDEQSEQYNMIQTLLQLLPRTRTDSFAAAADRNSDWVKMADDEINIDNIFSNDYMMLYMMLAGAFVPRFLCGEVKDGVQREITKLNMDPRNSFCISKVPSDITRNDEVTKKLIRDISLDDQSDVGQARLLQNDQFKYLVQSDTLYVEFMSDSDVSKTDRQVTTDVHPSVQYAFQFTESPGGREDDKRVPYDLTQSAAQRCGLPNNRLQIGMVKNPYRLKWQLMSFDGSPLLDPVCHAGFERWRNPGGFVCDVNKRNHYGIGYQATSNEKGSHCFVQGITLFPLYKQNLFALTLMLTFLPHQHGAKFKIQTDKMAITEVWLFGQKFDIYKDTPITETLIRAINKIRRVTSLIFGDKTFLQKSKFPPINLVQHYDELNICMSIGNKVLGQRPTGRETTNGVHDLRLIEMVDGFHEFADPDKTVVYERVDRTKSTYLQPYNAEVLFHRDTLEQYTADKRPNMDEDHLDLEELLNMFDL